MDHNDNSVCITLLLIMQFCPWENWIFIMIRSAKLLNVNLIAWPFEDKKAQWGSNACKDMNMYDNYEKKDVIKKCTTILTYSCCLYLKHFSLESVNTNFFI